MTLTKIKHKEIKRGDMLCNIDARVNRPVMIAFKDGNDPFFDPSTYNREVYRIDAPDYTHELTQFSWKHKQLDDKVESLIAHNNREGALVDVIKTRDERIEELEDMDKRAKTSVDYTNHCIDGLLIDQATLQDTVHQLRMKIFDIEGREDLVTTELERQIKEKDWRLGKQRSYIKGLVNDRTELQDINQKMTADKHKMLSELKECHLLDIGDWQTRVDKLLAETKGRERVNVRLMHKVEGLEDENRGLIKAIAKNDGTSLVNLEECQRSNRSMCGTIKALTKPDLKQLEKDELLASTKQAYESLHQRYDERQKEIDGLIEDKTVLQDVIQKMIADKDETVEAWSERVSERNDDIVALRSKINSLNTKLDECFVGRGDDSPITRMRRHISELEELHDIDIQAWSKRESELLEMVESRDRMIHHAVQQNNASMVILSNVNDAMTEMYGIVQDWYDASPNAMIMSTTNAAILKLYKLFCIASANDLFGDDVTIKIDGDRDGTFDPDMADGRHAADLEQLDLLDDILKIVNTTIHHKMRSPHRKNDTFDIERMHEVCDVVTDFRKEHNIVG